ncbi:MAG TPA: ABC transporter substrate-binding protein [Candidatus Binatia bacterium]|nr:ABC transporter substrate-binding protein [Candidatus Binatia bacterium]
MVTCTSAIRLWLSVLYVLLVLFPLSSQAQEKKSLRVVFTGLAWNSELPFRVALARGFFKAQGLEIQPIFVRGGPMALAALSSGEVDFAEIGGAQAIMRSRSRGLDVVIIGSISNVTTFQLIGSKSTRSLEDLKGKIIGVTGAGAFSDFAMRTFLRRKGIDPDKDVLLRAVGGSNMRVSALEKGIVAAAPFSPEDTVRLVRLGFPMIANMSDSLNIPQSIVVARNETLEKLPETSKRFLKALILGIQLAKTNKSDAIKAGYEGGLQGESDIVNQAYDLYAPAFTSDLTPNVSGFQFMLDEDKRSGLIDGKFTLDRVINDRLLKAAQQELRAEGRLK